MADLPGGDLHDDDLPMVVRRLAGVDTLERLVHLASYALSDDAPAREYVEETAALYGFTLPRMMGDARRARNAVWRAEHGFDLPPVGPVGLRLGRPLRVRFNG